MRHVWLMVVGKSQVGELQVRERYRVSHSKEHKVILLWWAYRFWILLICRVLCVHELGKFILSPKFFIEMMLHTICGSICKHLLFLSEVLSISNLSIHKAFKTLQAKITGYSKSKWQILNYDWDGFKLHIKPLNAALACLQFSSASKHYPIGRGYPLSLKLHDCCCVLKSNIKFRHVGSGEAWGEGTPPPDFGPPPPPDFWPPRYNSPPRFSVLATSL